MNLSDRADSYLMKTYCHLVNNVLPQAKKDQIDHPPAELWAKLIQEIIKAINAVSKELEARGIPVNYIDCSNMEF